MRPVDGHDELLQRVARLDGEPGDPLRPAGQFDLECFIAVLERVVDSGRSGYVSASTADRAMVGCRLLSRLDAVIPEIVSGPFRADSQFWVSGGTPAVAPSEADFVPAGAKQVEPVAAKPFGIGLFTSTGALGGLGMWRAYLQRNEWSTLHPKPWHTWSLTPRQDAVVREIADAAGWVDFVHTYPRRHHDLLYPDWRRAAADLDAVHVTLRAIAAIQGLRIRTARGDAAASYWDVECTFWLRWCFTAAHLVESVE